MRKLFEQSVTVAKSSYDPASREKPTLKAEDVIGPRPSGNNIPALAAALQDLDTNFVGLTKVKDAVRALVHDAQANWDLEMRGEKTTPPALNRLFLGNPGTGKTSVAAIYGRVLKVGEVATLIHTYIHTYVHTYIRAYIHTYVHPSTHTYIHTCLLYTSDAADE